MLSVQRHVDFDIIRTFDGRTSHCDSGIVDVGRGEFGRGESHSQVTVRREVETVDGQDSSSFHWTEMRGDKGDLRLGVVCKAGIRVDDVFSAVESDSDFQFFGIVDVLCADIGHLRRVAVHESLVENDSVHVDIITEDTIGRVWTSVQEVLSENGDLGESGGRTAQWTKRLNGRSLVVQVSETVSRPSIFREGEGERHVIWEFSWRR